MRPWNTKALRQLSEKLYRLRLNLVDMEEMSDDLLGEVAPPSLASARNLLHYVALRRHDLRDLQERLAALGLSSLGRAEGCVLATIDGVLQVLQQMDGGDGVGWTSPGPHYAEGKALLEARTEALLGPASEGRAVRIMVTVPGEAATDDGLVRDLLAAGMNCMRINCAHDGPPDWARMIAHLRRAQGELERPCRVLMDLPGPKLRTGSLEPGPRVLKWRPQRDVCGRVVRPARVWLTPSDAPPPTPGSADAVLPVTAEWLAGLGEGDCLHFRDARGAPRTLTIIESVGSGRWADCGRTAYVTTGTVLQLSKLGREEHGIVGALPAVEVPIVLHRGDTLVLTRDPIPGRPAECDAQGRVVRPAHVSCTLPEVFGDVRPGERVWLDDGKVGGVLRRVEADRLEIEVTQASGKGAKLGADKGINFPDSTLRLPALTESDLRDLEFVAAHADLVGLSFVHDPEDIAQLQAHLRRVGGERLGIVLKIETRRGFEQLPRLLLEAMRSPSVGVMIARGDLAVECGYERLAELQEEILWVCEAAHVPVIWATQVLEHLAKEGMPSRAEITDAAMGERAECVMLNKGAHIREAVRVLDNILRRMQAHQHKKRAMLRPLQLANHFSTSLAAR